MGCQLSHLESWEGDSQHLSAPLARPTLPLASQLSLPIFVEATKMSQVIAGAS